MTLGVQFVKGKVAEWATRRRHGSRDLGPPTPAVDVQNGLWPSETDLDMIEMKPRLCPTFGGAKTFWGSKGLNP